MSRCPGLDERVVIVAAVVGMFNAVKDGERFSIFAEAPHVLGNFASKCPSKPILKGRRGREALRALNTVRVGVEFSRRGFPGQRLTLSNPIDPVEVSKGARHGAIVDRVAGAHDNGNGFRRTIGVPNCGRGQGSAARGCQVFDRGKTVADAAERGIKQGIRHE